MLTSWEKFNPESLEKKRLIFFCNTARLQYTAGNGEVWQVNGTIKFNTVSQLDLFCWSQEVDTGSIHPSLRGSQG